MSFDVRIALFFIVVLMTLMFVIVISPAKFLQTPFVDPLAPGYEWTSRAADWLLRKLFTYRDIKKPDGSLYLRRFYITPHKWLGFDSRGRSRWPKVLGFVPTGLRKIFIHRILQSDERTPHDHPWAFTSVILAGEYYEHVTEYEGRQKCTTGVIAKFGSVLRRKANHIHRLEIVRPVWSLVFAGPSVRDWGFWLFERDQNGKPEWVDWRAFLNLPYDVKTEPEDQYPVAGAAVPTRYAFSGTYRGQALNLEGCPVVELPEGVSMVDVAEGRYSPTPDLSEDVPMDWDGAELETVPDARAQERANKAEPSFEERLESVFGGDGKSTQEQAAAFVGEIFTSSKGASRGK